MLLLTSKQNLFISEGLRLFATIFILFILHIPLFYKILLIILTDSFDCGLPNLFFQDWIDCNTNLYQFLDKTVDLISYIILFSHVVYIKHLEKDKNLILGFLLFYRTIGEICFFVFENRLFLLFFPNFFLETLLIFVGMKYFKISNVYLPCFMFLMILWKFFQEYYIHIHKNPSL
jgi:hypothetical protein